MTVHLLYRLQYGYRRTDRRVSNWKDVQVRQHTFMTVVLRDIRPVDSDNDIRTLKAVNNKGKSFMLADR